VVKHLYLFKEYRMNKTTIIILILFLSACVSPNVEQSTINFDDDKYHVDLNNCRGGTIFEASATSIGLAAGGAFAGVFYVAPWSSAWGNGWEAAAIGAAVGSAIGFGAGAFDSVKKYNNEITSCLSNKGYTLSGT
jgi:hypothetical protein